MAVQKEIVTEAERLDVKDKAVIVVCELLFKDPLKVANVIKTNRNFFLRVSAQLCKQKTRKTNLPPTLL